MVSLHVFVTERFANVDFIRAFNMAAIKIQDFRFRNPAFCQLEEIRISGISLVDFKQRPL
jgi:hypothetical protein